MLSSLHAADQDPAELLRRLKDVKNSLIGNTARKVGLVEEGGLAGYLVEKLSSITVGLQGSSTDDPVKLETLNELFVILGTLANVGPPTLSTLLTPSLPNHLLSSLTHLLHLPQTSYIQSKLLPSSLRALRNVLLGCADLLWGGLYGTITDPPRPRSNEDVDMDAPTTTAGEKWRARETTRLAREAISLLFHPTSLSTLLPLLSSPNPQTLLPLYTLLTHLTRLPTHRLALTSFPHPPPPAPPADRRARAVEPPSVAVSFPAISIALNQRLRDRQAGEGAVVKELCGRLGDATRGEGGNGKVTLGAVELLGVLCRDQPEVGLEVLAILLDQAPSAPSSPLLPPLSLPSTPNPVGGTPTIPFANTLTFLTLLSLLRQLLYSPSPPLALAAATLVVNIGKAVRVKGMLAGLVTGGSLYNVLGDVLGAGGEERVKAGFVLAYLVEDEEDLQKMACDTDIMSKVISVFKHSEKDEVGRVVPEALSARLKESSLLAMASLSLLHESPRATLIDSSLLPLLLPSLSHPSYAVRAAACQVCRALSRSVAILRTSLVDSGVGGRVWELLKEEEGRAQGRDGEWESGKGEEVLVAATATLCNLITEFSPMQTLMIDQGGMELLVRLCENKSEATRTNAIWALKNLIYKNELKMKERVMSALTWNGLRRLIENPSVNVQEQGLALMRNFVCEGTEEEVNALFEGLGEEGLFGLLEGRMGMGGEMEPIEQVMYIIYNIALGTEAHREAIMKREGVVQGLVDGLSHEHCVIRIAALGCLLNLIESNDRHRRPRQEIILRLKPYLLEPKVQALKADAYFDVRDKAEKVLRLLEMPGAGR